MYIHMDSGNMILFRKAKDDIHEETEDVVADETAEPSDEEDEVDETTDAEEDDDMITEASIEKEAGLFSTEIPQEGQFGFGLNEEAMKLLGKYNIDATELFNYDTPNSNFKDIYEGIQAAKSGNIEALRSALELRFGKKLF